MHWENTGHARVYGDLKRCKIAIFIHSFIFNLAPLVTLMATTYVVCWGSLLWFWITQGPSIKTVPYACTDTPPNNNNPHTKHRPTSIYHTATSYTTSCSC